jgi:flagellar basal body-associated protein FliL
MFKEKFINFKNKSVQKIKSHKKVVIITISIILTLIIISLGGLFLYSRIKYGVGMSVADKNKKISALIEEKEYTKAIELNDKYFNTDNLDNIIEHNENIKFIDGEYLKYNSTDPYDFKGIDYKKNIDFKLDKLERLKDDYYKVSITVNNKGNESIRYIKIGLHFSDKNNAGLNSGYDEYEIPCYDRINAGDSKILVGYIKQDNLQKAEGWINELVLNSQKTKPVTDKK